MNTIFATDWSQEVLDVDVPAETTIAPPGVSLADLSSKPIDKTRTLLGDRFLCVGGGAGFIGPSGIGKSSASVQQDACWALGREAFGINPARPLRILTVQAENDEGDLSEMASGVLSVLDLDEDAYDRLRENTLYVHEQSRVGAAFIDEVLIPLCEQFNPDLMRIDPLLAFCGCNPNDAEEMAAFLRAGLNPLLQRFNCAAIINHHTPKVTNRDTSKWRPADWMYAGMGSSDFTNWARAIIVIDPTCDPRVFKFIAAKRGGRIGWRDADGGAQFERFFSHSRTHGEINWSESTSEEIAAAESEKNGRHTSKVVPTAEQFLGLLPLADNGNPRDGVLSNAQVIAHFKANGWDKDVLAGIRDGLDSAGKIVVVVGAHNQKFVGRPALAKKFDRSRKEHGTILETPPLEPCA